MTHQPELNAEGQRETPELAELLKQQDPAFDAWVKSLPAKHWSKYDLSALRLGWNARATPSGEWDKAIEAVGRLIVADYLNWKSPFGSDESGTYEAGNRRAQAILTAIRTLTKGQQP